MVSNLPTIINLAPQVEHLNKAVVETWLQFGHFMRWVPFCLPFDTKRAVKTRGKGVKSCHSCKTAPTASRYSPTSEAVWASIENLRLNSTEARLKDCRASELSAW